MECTSWTWTSSRRRSRTVRDATYSRIPNVVLSAKISPRSDSRSVWRQSTVSRRPGRCFFIWTGVVNTSSATFRTAFAERSENARLALDRTLRRSKVDVIDIETGEPYVKPLMRFFQERMRRQR